MITRTRLADRAGYSLMEIMLVVALTGVIAAIAIPMMGNSLGFFRLSGDARAISNSMALAKMRAASVFGRVRIRFDLPARSFHLETWNAATNQWVSDAGGVTYLWLPVTIAPPATQAVIKEAATCKDPAGNDIPNTSCVIFNSRGIPIDSSANPQPVVDAMYVTDGSAVYGVTVSATGMVRTWKTPPTYSPQWMTQ
jgi:prepilin-type N-terminal cleavage/methylation domain-containing protein